MDVETLKSKLDGLDGWKQICKGGLFGGNAKKSFANYKAAAKKGIAKLYTLRLDEYDDSYYAVFAFSTMGGISDVEMAELSARARKIDLGEIRYESKEMTYLDCMRNFQQDLDVDDGKANQISILLSNEQAGRFVFLEARFEREELDLPFVVWAIDGRKILVFPFRS